MTKDMDTIKMSYEEMIDTLKGLVFGTFDRTTAKEREALDMAIKALQTEPSVDVFPISEGATNGDAVNALFDIDEGVEEVDCYGGYMYFKVKTDVWNAPYKGECNLSEKSAGSESEDKE